MKPFDPGRRPTVLRFLAGAFAFVLLVPVFFSIALLNAFLHPHRTPNG